MFTQEVTFGQYPLNVVGFHDLHESLEATTAQGEIETISGDSSQKSGQEVHSLNPTLACCLNNDRPWLTDPNTG